MILVCINDPGCLNDVFDTLVKRVDAQLCTQKRNEDDFVCNEIWTEECLAFISSTNATDVVVFDNNSIDVLALLYLSSFCNVNSIVLVYSKIDTALSNDMCQLASKCGYTMYETNQNGKVVYVFLRFGRESEFVSRFIPNLPCNTIV